MQFNISQHCVCNVSNYFSRVWPVDYCIEANMTLRKEKKPTPDSSQAVGWTPLVRLRAAEAQTGSEAKKNKSDFFMEKKGLLILTFIQIQVNLDFYFSHFHMNDNNLQGAGCELCLTSEVGHAWTSLKAIV